MLSEDVLRAFRAPIPRRDDKLANSVESLGLESVAWALRRIYDLRKKADYSREDVLADEAWEAFKIYREARRTLEEKLAER